MKVTDRDVKFFGFLGDFGVLSTNQICSLAFKNVAKTTVLRRLRTLEKKALIIRSTGLEDGGIAWTLSKKGASLSGQKVSQKYINRNTLDHDVALSQVRLALQSVGLGDNWQPEHVIRRFAWNDRSRYQRERTIVPDGIFVAYKNGAPQTIAVELELSLKSPERYDGIFDRYNWMRTLWAIWYIVGTKNIGEVILTKWHSKNRYTPATLCYSLASEIIENPREAKLYASDGRSDFLRECLKMTTLPAQGAAHPESGELENKRAATDLKSPRDSKETSICDSGKDLPSVADPSPPTLTDKRGEGVGDYRQEDSNNQTKIQTTGDNNNDAA